MKTVSKILMLMLLVGSFALSATLKTIGIYAPNENVTVHIKDQAADHKNWIGIYPRGSSNAWANVIKWDWTHGKNSVNIKGLPDGDYEARLFYNNSFKLEAKTYIIVDKYANATISTQKTVYAANENITIFTGGFSHEEKAWVGIYPAGSSNDWDNVLDWSWSESKSVSNTIVLDGLPKGKYEARLFLNNSFILEGKTAFSVGDEVEAIGKVQNAGANKVVTVTVNKHSSDDDWVGIFKKGVEKKWGNEIAWSFVEGENSVTITPNNNLPAGEYEVALFLDNSLDKVEASVGFVVRDGGNNHQYGAPGPYIDEVNKNPEMHGDYFVFYPKNHVDKAPLVLFSGYGNTIGYKGLMIYLASKGCYVVGHTARKVGEGWSDPKFRYERFEPAVVRAKNLGVDTSRLVTMGSSAGGMVSYKIMEHFKSEGYGATKSFVIDIEGYYASSMTKNDLNQFQSDSLIIALGGNTGMQNGNMSEDPRTLLTLSKSLNNNVKKSFIVLPSPNHGYASGDYAQLLNKLDLLKPIDAMLQYEFFNDQYNNVKAILFDKYDETVQKVYDATMVKVGNKEPLQIGYAYPCVNPYLPDGSGNKYDPNENGWGRPFEETINYCNDHGLQ